MRTEQSAASVQQAACLAMPAHHEQPQCGIVLACTCTHWPTPGYKGHMESTTGVDWTHRSTSTVRVHQTTIPCRVIVNPSQQMLPEQKERHSKCKMIKCMHGPMHGLPMKAASGTQPRQKGKGGLHSSRDSSKSTDLLERCITRTQAKARESLAWGW